VNEKIGYSHSTISTENVYQEKVTNARKTYNGQLDSNLADRAGELTAECSRGDA